ncbi:hypothetical protein RF11_08866 [Thelohanellus kitauei]|uniref:BPTI/Kunitz inhibitor domain-containing protein n=1 Tax=Thelohanellus kitauei TaxID=669202 RepID=A0A0C2J6Z7_THEKT|nr:hypothetical protein RF11_08866 [Thelohanellus kitauei]
MWINIKQVGVVPYLICAQNGAYLEYYPTGTWTLSHSPSTEPYIGSCTFLAKYYYYHYDINSRSCVQHKSCGVTDWHKEFNFFWDLDECNRDCASPHMVTTENWGESYLRASLTGDFLIAFNKYAGDCVPYIKTDYYRDINPLTFNTTEECRQYCIADTTHS